MGCFSSGHLTRSSPYTHGRAPSGRQKAAKSVCTLMTVSWFFSCLAREQQWSECMNIINFRKYTSIWQAQFLPNYGHLQAWWIPLASWRSHSNDHTRIPLVHGHVTCTKFFRTHSANHASINVVHSNATIMHRQS